jgi:hypothetical protein
MRSGLQELLVASFLVLCGCRTSGPPGAGFAAPIRKGVVTTPGSPSVVAKTYFHTLDHCLLFLTLRQDGSYFAEVGDGMHDGSVSRGQWRLQESRITLEVPEEKTLTAMWLRECADLDVLWSERGWVLLPCGVFHRKFYEEHGVCGEACFIERRKRK